MVFSDEPLPISDYLKELDKNWLIRFALFIIYSGGKFKTLNNYVTTFFCKQNHDFVKSVLDIMNNHYAKTLNDPTNIIPRTYFILSESTGLELLKQIFSISNFTNVLPQTTQEQYLFKAILLINSNISETNVLEEFDDNKNFTNLYYAKSLVCNFINNHERLNLKSEFISVLQIIKGYYFFKFCEKSKLQPHLTQFLKNNGFQSWTQYLYNVIQLILYPLQNENDKFPVIKLNERLEGYNYLHAHSFSADYVIPTSENSDYTFFKTYPLIEIDKQTFLPINAIFCINHLYRSVYFEFNKINASFDNSVKIKGFPTYITTEFSEKYLWEIADPKGLNDDLCGKINKNEQLRRVIRYIKKWRNDKYENSTLDHEVPPSIGLTYLACDCFVSSATSEGEDDLMALQQTMSNMKSMFTLTYEDEKLVKADISRYLPVEPFTDVFQKMKDASDSYGVTFYNRLSTAVQNLTDAVNVESEHDAGNYVKKVLGEEFKVPAKQTSSPIPQNKKEHSFG